MASGDTSAYSGAGNPQHLEYNNPEYAVIRWDAHGKGRLTIKLALWCLAMMATRGDRYIDYSYPDLDTWRSAGKGKGFVHNTSGIHRSKLSKAHIRQEPDPGREWREAMARDFDIGPDGNSGASEDPGGPSGAQQSSAPRSGQYYEGFQSLDGGGDVPVFSQASSVYGGDLGSGYDVDDYEGGLPGFGGETVVAGPSSGPAAGPSSIRQQRDDEQTVRRSTRNKGKGKEDNLHTVKVMKRKTGKKNLYFITSDGKEVETSKDKWKKVGDGYTYAVKSNVYFTKEFPK